MQVCTQEALCSGRCVVKWLKAGGPYMTQYPPAAGREFDSLHVFPLPSALIPVPLQHQ